MPDLVRPTVEVPVLETARLRLRGHRPDDFAACAAMWADPVVFRYIGGKPFSPGRSLDPPAALRRTLGVARLRLLGARGKSLRANLSASWASPISSVTSSLRSTTCRNWAGRWSRQAHGKGYATEAVRAAIAWGDKHFGQKQTACLIHPENRGVDSRGGEVRLSRVPAYDVQESRSDHVCAAVPTLADGARATAAAVSPLAASRTPVSRIAECR